jgi:hypothetical protein
VADEWVGVLRFVRVKINPRDVRIEVPLDKFEQIVGVERASPREMIVWIAKEVEKP